MSSGYGYGNELIYLTIILLMLVTILGPSLVIGMIGYAAITALGRNPSAAPKIMMAMITALMFAEALAIAALIIVAPLLSTQIEAVAKAATGQ